MKGEFYKSLDTSTANIYNRKWSLDDQRRCKTKNENNHGDTEYTENRRTKKGREI